EEAMRVLMNRCKEADVSPIIGNCQVFEENLPEISFKTKKDIYPNVRLSLNGEHQRQNACTAISLTEILSTRFNFQISVVDIICGLEKAEHKGRLEWRNIGEVQFLFDGAHNIAGAQALGKYLKFQYAESKITMVFGTMRDKNLREIAEILFPLAENLILTEPDNPRSAEIEDLRTVAEKVVEKEKIFAVQNVSAAIDLARQIAAAKSATKHSFVCVTGSLYLIGEAQEILQNSF
ncbi:MAG TPA: cyanophycin synthetase, partial [Pyrinomonadaceae bacterium]